MFPFYVENVLNIHNLAESCYFVHAFCNFLIARHSCLFEEYMMLKNVECEFFWIRLNTCIVSEYWIWIDVLFNFSVVAVVADTTSANAISTGIKLTTYSIFNEQLFKRFFHLNFQTLPPAKRPNKFGYYEFWTRKWSVGNWWEWKYANSSLNKLIGCKFVRLQWIMVTSIRIICWINYMAFV